MASSPDLSDETHFPIQHKVDVAAQLRRQVPTANAIQDLWGAILDAWATEIQDLETEAFNDVAAGSIDLAGGYALTLVARMLWEERGGLDSARLRRLVRARGVANNSDGNRVGILDTWRALVGPNVAVRSSYPASIYAESRLDDFTSWYATGMAFRSAPIFSQSVAGGIGVDAVVGPPELFTLSAAAAAGSPVSAGASPLGAVGATLSPPLGTALTMP